MDWLKAGVNTFRSLFWRLVEWGFLGGVVVVLIIVGLILLIRKC